MVCILSKEEWPHVKYFPEFKLFYRNSDIFSQNSDLKVRIKKLSIRERATLLCVNRAAGVAFLSSADSSCVPCSIVFLNTV